MPRRPRGSRLGGSRGVPVLVPVRASPVPRFLYFFFFLAAPNMRTLSNHAALQQVSFSFLSIQTASAGELTRDYPRLVADIGESGVARLALRRMCALRATEAGEATA